MSPVRPERKLLLVGHIAQLVNGLLDTFARGRLHIGVIVEVIGH